MVNTIFCDDDEYNRYFYHCTRTLRKKYS